MFERMLEEFKKDFWRSLFYASLALLVLAVAVRLIIPPWTHFGRDGLYYKMNRFTGEVYRVSPSYVKPLKEVNP